MDQLAFGIGLMRDQPFAEQRIGSVPDLVLIPAKPDAACLAAATCMDLSFHRPSVAADLPGPVRGLLRAVSDAAAWDRDAKLRQDFLGLILMNVHDSSLTACEGLHPRAAATMFR